ncbi:MAG TPA: hypothetical protein VE689_03115, partial [Candidatus Udaeobacter sp.]|nr:hypothetical protein [Candidatus Udaeobacter sp.]
MEPLIAPKDDKDAAQPIRNDINGKTIPEEASVINLAKERAEGKLHEYAPRERKRARLSTIRTLLEVFSDLCSDIAGKKRYQRYLERNDRLRRLAGQIFLLGNVGWGLLYIAWFASVINWDVWYVSVPFLFAEIVGLLTSTYFAIIIWYPRYHRPEGINWNSTPSVDVFITTCGEPVNVLQRTLAAAGQIDYP